MTTAAECSTFRRVAARLLPLVLLVAGTASVATAAPADANHRFERIGYSVGNVAAVVPIPGEMRAIVVTKNGEVHRVAGDRLVDELMGTFTVSQTCDGDGVLDAAWDIQGNAAIFVTYIQASPRKFVIARLDITGARVGAPQQLYSFPVGTSVGCTNLGGGITMAADGKLLVGVGDMGNGPGAGQGTVITGKILRVNATMPGGPAADNPSPTSPVYGLGVRNPIRMSLDTVTGRVWFVDVGPSANDELNWISGPSINYAWPRASGPFNTNGFRDPAFTWAAAINPTGVIANNGQNFGPSWLGDAIVSAANGRMFRVHPPATLTEQATNSTSTTIFTPGTGEPGALQTLWSSEDGYAYAATANGEMFRLRNNNGPIQEPSDASSILPLLVRKLSGGGLDLLAERETALDKYGFYPGSLTTFYSHFDPANPLPDSSNCATTTGATAGCAQGDTSTTSAWSHIQMSQAQVDAMPDLAYFVLSGINTRAETAVGRASSGLTEPGGLQTFGCPCPAGINEGYVIDSCMTPFTLARGYWSEGGGDITNVTVDGDFDCNVILIDLSEDWCYWCHQLAPDLETIYTDYKSRGFTLITLLSQDASGNDATYATVQGWVSRHGSTNPVLLDERQRVMNLYFDNVNCGGFPQSLLFDADGVYVQNICGYDPTTIRAAVDREVVRAGR